MSLLHSFGVNTSDHLQRSRIDFPMRKRCEFRQGALIPLVHKFVIPNSTWACNADAVVRLLLTPARPFMGDMYFTYGFYFVPLRILFKDYPKMFGNGEPSDWQNPTEWIMPTQSFIIAGDRSVRSLSVGYDACVPGGASVNSSGDLVSVPGNLTNYCGNPATRTTGSKSTEIQIAPEAAYLSIWNYNWRDENYQNSDPDVSKIFNFSGGSAGHRTLCLSLHYANAFHDYFTSLLPNTQKGPASSAFSHLICLPDLYTMEYLPGDDATDVSIKFGDYNRNEYQNGVLSTNTYGNLVNSSTSSVSSSANIGSTNLGVDITVEKLRMAFATQRARERDARTGGGANRFVESMLGIFEAHLPNAVSDEPEFLGGNTIQLNLTSVPATAKATGSSPGSLGAFSFTRDNSGAFVKTFDEPGVLMAVGCVRIKRVYSQGIDRDRFKTRRFDFYDPCFAHINEQPVWLGQYLAASNRDVKSVLGFNEAWAEDVKPVDEVSGLMGDPEGPTDLHKWNLLHFQTQNSSPHPEDYLPEKFDEVANACVDYNTAYPTWVFSVDFHANCKVTAPRPVYSKPGLIDHLIV